MDGVILIYSIMGFPGLGEKWLRQTVIAKHENPGFWDVPRVGEYVEGGPLNGVVAVPQARVDNIFHNLNERIVEVRLEPDRTYRDHELKFFPCADADEYNKNLCHDFDEKLKRFVVKGWKIENAECLLSKLPDLVCPDTSDVLTIVGKKRK